MIPPRTILAAVNFADASRASLVLAARLARPCGAQLHVLHVEDPLLHTAARHAGVDAERETRRELRRLIAEAWPAPECSPQSHLTIGTVVDAILEVAHEHHADLIVVSSAGKSGAERFVFGSTTEHLLRRSDVSVLVAPANWTPPDPRARDLSGLGPLVTIDDSADTRSPAAASTAQNLASVLGTSVEIAPAVPDAAVLSQRRAVVLCTKARGARRFTPALARFRALAAATVPILMQVVDQIG